MNLTLTTKPHRVKVLEPLLVLGLALLAGDDPVHDHVGVVLRPPGQCSAISFGDVKYYNAM